jgi:hypothetical protein
MVGKWSIEFERGRQVENGVVTPIMGRGTLVVQQSGGVFTATLDAGPRPDGTPAPPVTMQGALRGSDVVFEQKGRARLDVNGEVKEVEVTTTWSLHADGDALSGTMTRALPMAPDAGGSTPVRGTRAR